MRKLIITKEQAERLKEYMINEELGSMPVPKKTSKPYTISPEKVTIVQRFLDNNFKKGNYESIGADGFPQKTPIVAMLSSDGQVLKNMYIEQLKDLLIDKFQKMFTDDDERSAFFDKVIEDWFNGKIGLFGMLSVNYLCENEMKSRTIYHCVSGFRNIEEVCKSIGKKGLCPNDNSEIGNVIWFAYEPFYKNASLIFSMQLNKKTISKYNITFDDGTAWAHKPIPINELAIERAPSCNIPNYGPSLVIDFNDPMPLDKLYIETINNGFSNVTDVYGKVSIYTDILYPLLSESQVKKIRENPLIVETTLFGKALHLNENNISEKLPSVRKDVDINPTDGQKEAGNYKKGHITVLGMDITIEQPKGSYRKGKDEKGNEWKTLMKNDYGYFTKSVGYDGDAVDVFIGPHIDDFDKVYVVDQNNLSGEFDESKVMLGFKSKPEAKKAYLSNYSKDWKGFRSIIGVSLKLFKKWLYRGRKQRQPFAEYVEIKRNQLKESKQLTPMDDYCDFTASDMGRHLEPGRFSNTPKTAEPEFDGWKRVRKGAKMNLQNTNDGNLLSNHWFDWIGYMIDGVAIVQDGGKWNFIREDGSILSNVWFDDVNEFDGDTAEVIVKGKDGEGINKKIDRNGNLLS